ncbi:Cof-type HAD-IIB family hydrolase [Vagococcus fluvialis]|uniref:HAD family hydrolase n=1 Tax=Vagococcus fluvialis TaxID=2738 RepID=A0A369B5V3_9ENTE|nr:Cof-type HAD-IIB family hydrolase [Vagococcus fluvialis]MBO0486860.1 HAD family phosphatase [Vagococcus fluvialis]MCM2138424.1 Cof-type HAD-IIB family hydrolase [Vagococcus fluvialis]MDT2747178.1 Cof-type HAD-IIB family hydrolase [Vagococcus fluvialis]MDT2782128.1 Cof-type HAD-IIB family hydrolase [Vagococcus fluvialis]NKC59167.1 HAD family phosphatase [Vagococcus fluvialis]
MIKMIASDMDGTLLSSHLAISETNKEAVLEAQAQGIEFMVATGRAYSEAKPALDDAGIKCCMITGNGAQIFDENGEAIVTFSIDKKTTKEIMTTLREKNLYFELMTTNGVYAESQPQRVENFATLLANQVPHLTFKMAIAMASTHLNMLPVHYINNYDDLLVDDSVEILKVIAFSDEGPKLLRPIADELEANGPLYVTASFPNNIEINHKDAQKGNAVKLMAEKRGIGLEDVMTIGDNFNDVSMLKVAGVSFAMGNAEEDVKKIAKYEADTNMNHGVGKAILRAISENL